MYVFSMSGFVLQPSHSLDTRPDGKSISRPCRQALFSWIRDVSMHDRLEGGGLNAELFRLVTILDQADEKSAIWHVAGRIWTQTSRVMILDPDSIRIRIKTEHLEITITELVQRSSAWSREEDDEKILRCVLLNAIGMIEDLVLSRDPMMGRWAMMTAIVGAWATTAQGGTYVIHADMPVEDTIFLYNIAGDTIMKFNCFKIKGLRSYNPLQRSILELQDEMDTLRKQGRLNIRGKLSFQLSAVLENVLSENDFCITPVHDWTPKASSSSSSPARHLKRLVNRKLRKPLSNEHQPPPEFVWIQDSK